MTEYQPPLFADPVQPRRKRMEPAGYYDAVVALRNAGYRVVRAGRWHALVNGKQLSAADVIRLADALSASQR